jgi:DNA-binding CsgD family transcriptional regulator
VNDAVLGAGPDVVAREAEQRRIAGFIAALPTGARALALIGEPGIGKTALWRHAVEQCRLAGHRVLGARPAEEEMSLALGVLLDLFEAEELDAAALQTDESPLVRGRMVLAALRRLAEHRPVVIAIDDLQWIDSASARVLRFALRRLDAEPVGLLATVRTGAREPLGPRASLPPGRHEALELGPLDLEPLRRVLAMAIESISRPALRRIHATSGGNPLFAIELARALESSARMGRAPTRLPGSLQAAIAGRLEQVPDELWPLLEAVSGHEPTTVAELRAVVDASDVDERLAAAERCDMLVVDDDLRVRFSHPMIASEVYARLPTVARRSLHARLAALAGDPDQRARHLALSTDAPDAEIAEALEQAAGRAASRGAPDVAAEYARHARRLTPSQDTASARRRALAEIESLAAAGEVSQALAVANDLVAALPQGQVRAQLLLDLADLQDDDAATSVAFLEQALDEAEGDDRLRGLALSQLANHRVILTGTIDESIAYARDALAIAERTGDAELEASTTADLAYYEALAGRSRSTAAPGEDVAPSTVSSQTARTLLAKQLLWAGNLAAAQELYSSALTDLVSSGNEFQRPYRLNDLALVELAAGRLNAAAQLVHEGLEAAGDAEDAYAKRLLLYPLALVRVWQGHPEAGREAAERLLAESTSQGNRPGVARARSVLGVLALSEERADAAADELAAAAHLLDDMGIGHPAAVVAALPDAVEALASAGRNAEAGVLLERLECQARAVDVAWPHAALDRCRGVVLLAGGEPEAAAPLLVRAAAAFERLGCGPEAARAVLAHGRAVMRAGQRTRAAEALSDARRRFAAMGAPLWEAQAVRDLERVAPGRSTGELTPNELAIAELVAQGRRNRDISGILFMSVPTVEAHLTRLYRKLGIRSRSELARLVAEGTFGRR